MTNQNAMKKRTIITMKEYHKLNPYKYSKLLQRLNANRKKVELKKVKLSFSKEDITTYLINQILN